jgi:hypothetical protein
MPFSGTLRCVTLVRTDVLEECIISIIILVTLMTEAIYFSETSVLSGATLRKTPEDGILQLLANYS